MGTWRTCPLYHSAFSKPEQKCPVGTSVGVWDVLRFASQFEWAQADVVTCSNAVCLRHSQKSGEIKLVKGVNPPLPLYNTLRLLLHFFYKGRPLPLLLV